MNTIAPVQGPVFLKSRTLLAFLFGAGLAAVALFEGVSAKAEPGFERLVTRVRPAGTTVAKPISIGEEVSTTSGERRRLALPHGSIMYLNENSRAKLEAPRQINLAAGEVFIDPAPGKEGLFTVKTAKGEIAGSQSQFAVRAEAAGPAVIVTRGRVKVRGINDPVVAGQELSPGAVRPVTAARASHVLDWVRDSMAAAESLLVPASKYAGGALVAVDPNGQEAKLSLRKFHIDVHIEDGFARTTIDQTYFNHQPTRLEGTFYFPLPADASLSRLAMYVDGQRMEGGMVERDYARQVYESILYRQRDPALLEWVDGTTFKMRVFPLEPRQEKRIIVSYSQKLPSLYGREQYRFPAGHTLESVRDWSFHARIKNAGPIHWSSPSHTLKATNEGTDLLLDAADKNVKPNRDVVVFLSDREDGVEPGQKPGIARFSSAEHEGAKYLMVRYRPNLSPGPVTHGSPIRGGERGGVRDWVVLFESSGDRDPLLARAQIEIVRSLLTQAEPGDNFAVLAAGTRVRTLEGTTGPGLLPVTPENVQSAVAFLEGTHLIGALDLGNALTEAGHLLKAGKNRWLVHVGSGIAAMGERRDRELIQHIPQGAHYVGIGVGKRWARNFMKAAAEQTGGYFTQINPDESISWRTFDLLATLNTPRLLNVSVTVETPGCQFLTDTSLVAQGEELWAVARLGPETKTLPEAMRITGTVDGKPFEESLPVQNVAEHADYLPRTWAKLEIDRLLSELSREPQASADEGAKERLKSKSIELSKAMYVMTPFTSLLVLENEDMYVQYKVDRGRRDHWAMYPCPAKMPIVYEPLPGMPASLGEAVKGRKPSPEEVAKTILLRGLPDFFEGREGSRSPSSPMQDSAFQVATDSVPGVPSPLFDPSALPRVVSQQFQRYGFNDEPAVSFPPRAVWRRISNLANPPFGGFPGKALQTGGVAGISFQMTYLNRLFADRKSDGVYFAGRFQGLASFEASGERKKARSGMNFIAGQLIGGDYRTPIFSPYRDLLISAQESGTGSLLFGVGIDKDSAGGGGTPDIQEQVQEISREPLLVLQNPGSSINVPPSRAMTVSSTT